MSKQDYQNSISVSSAPHEIFETITSRISEWWSNDFQGSGKTKGDEFTVRFGPTFKTMRITEVVKNTKVVWLCIDQNIEMPPGMEQLKNKSEWVGNEIIWEIVPDTDNANTILKLHHVGLNPEVECWSVCEQGWDQTLKSIYQLLTTAKGQPFEQLDGAHLTKAKEYQAKVLHERR